MKRPRLQPGEPETAQQLAHAAFVQTDRETLDDLLAQIDAAVQSTAHERRGGLREISPLTPVSLYRCTQSRRVVGSGGPCRTVPPPPCATSPPGLARSPAGGEPEPRPGSSPRS